MLNFRRLAILPLVFGLLAGCGKSPPNPEAELRQLIDAAEQAAGERDLSAVMGLVAPDYRDARQQGWAQLRGMLAGYFLRHPSIFILSKVDSIELAADGEAKVVVFAGLAGSATEAAAPLTGWRGNLLRLDLQLRRNDEGAWRLHQAAWRPAVREDFIE